MADDRSNYLFKGCTNHKDGRRDKTYHFMISKAYVYSAPPPVQMRVVSYEIICWLGDNPPQSDEEWSSHKTFRSKLGLKSFSFTWGTMPYTLEMLHSKIKDHFGSVVLQNKGSRNALDGIQRMMELNTQTGQSTHSDGSKLFVFKVHHVAKTALTKSYTPSVFEQSLRYRARLSDANGQSLLISDWGDGYIELDKEYDDHRKLVQDALFDFTYPGRQSSIMEKYGVVS